MEDLTATKKDLGSIMNISAQKSPSKRGQSITKIKIETQKSFQYNEKGISDGNSPIKFRRGDSKLKSQISQTKLLGLGVSAPSEQFMMKF